MNRLGTAGGNDGSGIGTFFDFPGNLSFSPDGRYFAFRSLATDLTDFVTTAHRNLYARDLLANRTILLTPNTAGTDSGDGDSDTAVFSADGRFVAFQSTSNNLVAGDHRRPGSGAIDRDVFVRDLAAAHPVLVSAATPLLPAAYSTNGGGSLGSVSADGRYVAFTSGVFYGQSFSDLAPTVTFVSDFSTSHAFIRDRQTGAIEVVDRNASGAAVGGTFPVLSSTGRYVSFRGYTNLLPSGIATSDVHDGNIFVRDRQTGRLTVASLTPDGTHDVPVTDTYAAISDDGRYVAFTSEATAPIPGVSNPSGHQALFLRDLVAGTTTLVSHDVANDGQVRGNSINFSMSGDGRYVVFRSTDANLADGDANGDYDVFRWDRTTNGVALASATLTGVPGNKGSAQEGDRPVMTPDGRYVAFSSSASDLVSGDTNGVSDIFLRDMQSTAAPTLISRRSDGGLGDWGAGSPSISADGNRVAFITRSRLTGEPTLAGSDNTFVRDRSAGTLTMATVNLSGVGVGGGGTISPDGRYVFFGSYDTGLVSDFVDGNGSSGGDLYVRDLQQRLTKLVSVNQSGTASGNATGNSNEYTYRIAGDGSAVFFDGNESDLFANDRNGQRDAFAAATAGYSTIRGQVFNDANNNGVKDGGEAGLRFWTVYLDTNNNGKLEAGETSLITDASGNYAFTGLIPGTYKVAIVAQTGWTRSMPGAAGTYTVTITADGSTTTGKDFGELLPAPDLATSGVTITPASGAPGQLVTVSWTVSNGGNAAAAGAWQDAVYLSPTPALGPDAPLLTTVAHTGGLAVGAQYTGSVQLALPASVGAWYVIVRADRRTQVNEGLLGENKENNTAGSASTLNVGIPTLPLDLPTSDTLTAAGPDRHFQLTAEAGQSLLFGLGSAATGGQLELYVKRGGLPAPYDFDFAARAPGNPGQFLTIPVAQTGTYYVLVHGVSGAARTATFTLLATQPGVTLQSLGLSSGGNTGRVTIPLHGADIARKAAVNLIRGATSLSPVAVEYSDASLLYATFDLTGQAAGSYDVRVTQGAKAATLAGAFTVAPGVAKAPLLTLTSPTAIRTNRPYGQLVITYENPGNIDMAAPLIEVSADDASLRLPEQLVFEGGSVQFLATSADGPAGVLRPGQRGEIVIPFQTTPTTGVIHFKTRIADNSLPMNWEVLKDALRMDHIPPAAWDAIYANFTSAVGTTVGSYLSVLASDAAYLSELGESTHDIARLLAFELNKASGYFAGQSLATVYDASFPAPGLPLSFTRTFQQTIAGRYTPGPLGQGWVDNWQISAETDEEGNVEVAMAGAFRFFRRQADGTFKAGPGDSAMLTQIGGVYQLRERGGMVFVFNLDGTLNYVQDPNGNRITAGYTGGRLTSLTHSDGAALAIHYNAQGLIDRVTDPAGRFSTYTYDVTGEHLLTYTDKYGATNYSYLTGQSNPALNNTLTQIVYSDNTHEYFGYDSRGRLVDQHRDNDQQAVAYDYGAVGGYTLTNAVGDRATYLIDDAGQVIQVINGMGQVERYTYDSNFNLTRTATSLGVTAEYNYDSAGNLTSIVDPSGNTVRYTYDGSHHLLSYQDARGNTTKFRPDSLGNLLAVASADGNAQQFHYDSFGNLTETINARGQSLRSTYYANGQLKDKTYADGSTVTYTYDSHGNLTSAVQSTGAGSLTTSMTYDPATDTLTRIDYPDGKYLEFRYNSVAQRTRSIDQSGFIVNYGYDTLGRLSQLTDSSDHLIVRYTYDAAGRLVEKTLGNDTYTQYKYDAAGRVISVANHGPRPGAQGDGPLNSHFDYTYDELGRVVRVDESYGRWDYTYDANGQVTHAVFTSNDPVVLPNQDLGYVYDAAGNRTRSVANGVVTLYTTNQLNEYTQVGSVTYTYDVDGNLRTKTDGGVTTTYTFDQENRLTASGNPTDSWSYQYDPFGERGATTHNGVSTRDVIDPIGLGNLVARYDSSGALIEHFTHGFGLVSEVSAEGSASYYDFDLVGNTAGLTGPDGAYTNRYHYDPFGRTTTVSTAVANPFTFSGELGVQEDGGGLLSMRARSYDAAVGQFVSNDPLGLFGGDTNIRRYAGNNPVMFTDPSGLCIHIPIVGKPTRIRQTSLPPQGLNQYEDEFLKAGDTTYQVYYTIDAEGNYHYWIPEQSWTDKQTGQVHETWTEIDPIAVDPPLVPPGNPPNAPPGGSGPGACPCGCPNPSPPPLGGPSGPDSRTPKKGPADPNEIVGPSGIGVQNWVTPQQTLPYTVKFENDPKKATVAAQDVLITTTLDADLDWSTFQLGDIQFGSTVITVPAGLRSYSTSVKASNIDGTPLRVDVRASLDEDTGVATWVFRSLDPLTGDVPANPFAGFLPVDDATHRGEGQVSYTVRAKLSLPTETALTAQASIVFDTNAALPTNVASNPLYNGPRLLAADDYNRADNTNLGSGWVERAGNLAVAGNQLQSLTTVGVATAAGVSAADIRVQADVNVPNNRSAGLVVRYQGAGDRNLYFGAVTGAAGKFNAEIWRNVNGAWTLLSRRAIASGAGTLAFEAVGSSLKLYFNGAQVVYALDSALTAGGVGVRGGLQATIDNFRSDKLYALAQVLPVAAAFDGPDGAQLDTTRWQERVGNFSTAGNAARGDAAVNLATVTGVVAQYTDQQVALVLPPTGTQSAGLVARYGGAGDRNLYLGWVTAANGHYTAAIYRNVNGAWALLGSAPVTTGTGTLRFVVYGDALKLYFNGALVLTRYDANLTTGGVGVRTSAGAAVNDYSAQSIAPLALPFTDSFTAGDGARLADAWRYAAGSFAVQGNQARAGAAAVNLGVLNGLSLADGATEMALALPATGTQPAGLVARYAGAGRDVNLYLGWVTAASGRYTAAIYRDVGGAWALLASKAVTTGTGTLRFVAYGTSLQLFLNGALVASAFDAALASGSVGVRASGGASLDGFRVEAFAPAAAAVPFSDSFTGANGAPLADAWRSLAGGFTVQNNQARGAAAVNLSLLNGLSLADSSTQLTLALPATGTYSAGLVARSAGSGDRNMYWAAVSAVNGVYTALIYRNVNGVWALLSSRRVARGTGVLRFDAIGSSLKLFLDGAEVGAASDTALTSGGVGIRASQGATVDDFRTL